MKKLLKRQLHEAFNDANNLRHTVGQLDSGTQYKIFDRIIGHLDKLINLEESALVSLVQQLEIELLHAKGECEGAETASE